MPAARLLHLAAPAAPADADLLARFVAARDEAAFAELVRRHGPAVLAVCRRVTTRTPDAEDAFQAAFLVLARKAHRVRPGEPLAAWLYGVAVRAARKAARRTFRRHARETLVADPPDVPARTAEPFDADAARAVLEEVERLSAPYRAAVVLCELEGRSRAAAARELGVAEGTLSSRLAAARKLLARRLAARGFAPAALAALAADPLPPRLTAAASALLTGPAPAAVDSLARGVTRAMNRSVICAFGLTVAVVAAAAVAGITGAPPAGAPVMPATAAAPPAAAPPGGRILVWCGGNPVLLRPDGTGAWPLPGTGFEDAPGLVRLHPDGKRFAYSAEEQPRPADDEPRTEVYVRELDAAGLGARVPTTGAAVAWGAAGARLFGSDGAATNLAWEANADGTDLAAFTLPADHRLIDRSPDGRHLLALSYPVGEEGPVRGIAQLLRADRSRVAVVSGDGGRATTARFTPDGKAILIVADPPADAAHPGQPVIRRVRMKDLTTTVVTRLPKGAVVEGVCGSPDGTRVAYAWLPVPPDGTRPADREYRLTVCDLRGENSATVYRRTGTALGSVDWR